MEQKKTLWIIVAVGAFLLVVLGTAGLLYSPNKNQTQTIAKVSPIETKTIINNEPIPVSSSPVVQEISQEEPTTFDLNDLKNGYYEEDEINPSQPQNINITVNLPETKNVTNIKNQVEFIDVDSTSKKNLPPKQQNVKNLPKIQKSDKNTKVQQKTTVKQNTQKTVYFVQVGAYSHKKGAENARSVLQENKISADIFTYPDKKGNVWYRVRIGPYTTKSEAEYWRTRIIQIDTFAKSESFVTSTVVE